MVHEIVDTNIETRDLIFNLRLYNFIVARIRVDNRGYYYDHYYRHYNKITCIFHSGYHAEFLCCTRAKPSIQ